jgi:hypothetical protein
MRTKRITTAAWYLVIKAGLVTLLSLAASRLPHLNEPITIAFAAILCIPSAFYRGLKNGVKNLYATVIGAFVGTVLIVALDKDYLAIPPGVVIVCLACYVFNWLDYFPLAAFTLLVVSYYPEESNWITSLWRTVQVAVGIGIAMFVNWAVSRFRYRDLYLSRFRELLRIEGEAFDRMDECFLSGNAAGMERLEVRFHRLFRLISSAIDEMADLKKELRIRKESGGLSYQAVVWLARITDRLAAVAHYSWDIVTFGQEVMRENLLPPEEKAALDAEISGIAERFREIIEACVSDSSPPPRETEQKPRDRTAGGGAEDMHVASLRMSVRHLAAEVEELAGFVRIFLEQT